MSAALTSQPIATVELIGVDGYQFSGDNATVQRKCQFITLYREHGSILHASRLTPVNRKTVYRWIESDEQFAEAVADSKDECVEELETSVYKRAFTDSILAMFYLKAHRPQYRDKVQVDIAALNDEIQQRMKQVGVQKVPMESSLTMHFPSLPDEIQKEHQASQSLQVSPLDTPDNSNQ
jgi:hypothetical protein